MTTTVECPFCHVGSDPTATAGYCETCGRRLPTSSAYTSRQERRRRELSTGEEPRLRSRNPTAEALLTASVLRLIVGGVFLVAAPIFLREVPKFFLPAVMIVTITLTGFLALMGLWGYRQPQPAAWGALGGFLVAWAVMLILFLGAWPFALVDLFLLGWLVWCVLLAQKER